MSDDRLAALLKLYRPNTNVGNFHGDIYSRGWNAALAKAIVTAGAATMEHVTSEFGRLDREQQDRQDAHLAELNARERA